MKGTLWSSSSCNLTVTEARGNVPPVVSKEGGDDGFNIADMLQCNQVKCWAYQAHLTYLRRNCLIGAALSCVAARGS